MDTFAIRLAVVRAVMGWNYDQAARATGIGSETWRTWEKGIRRCTDVVGVSRQISDATDGVVSADWLILGGPLAQEPAQVRDLPHRRVASGGPRSRRGDQGEGVTVRYVRRGRNHTPARRPLLTHGSVRPSPDEWRIPRLPGSVVRPIILRRHAGNPARCQRVAA